MIAHLRGQISALSPTSVIIECSGVGYFVNISLNTYTYLSNQQGEVKLLTTQIIREDAHHLYGFGSEAERELFLHLISVSGIGPNTARIILSQYKAQELNTILTLGQVDALKAVKGIGLKTAQRIILELKGKLQLSADEAGGSEGGNLMPLPDTQTADEAVSALKMLGYPEAAAQKAVRQLLSASPTLPVADLIKQALKAL